MIPNRLLPAVGTAVYPAVPASSNDPAATEEYVASDYINVSLGTFLARTANKMEISAGVLLEVAIKYGVRHLDSAMREHLREELEVVAVADLEREPGAPMPT